jgi:hypothetical protein
VLVLAFCTSTRAELVSYSPYLARRGGANPCRRGEGSVKGYSPRRDPPSSDYGAASKKAEMLKFTQLDFLTLQNGADESLVRAFMGVVDELWRLPRWTQSPEEELANTISHGIGLVAALIATPVLLLAALDAREVASVGGTRFEHIQIPDYGLKIGTVVKDDGY